MFNFIKKPFLRFINNDNYENEEDEKFEFIPDDIKINIFKSSIEFAKRVINEYEHRKIDENLPNTSRHPVIDVICLLAKQTQFKHIGYTLFEPEYGRNNNVRYSTLFFNSSKPLTQDGKYIYDIIANLNENRTIDLSKDIIFPWPWNVDRLVNCIANIGEDRWGGRWRQDGNHSVFIWLPLGIAWVAGGNHSITAGILKGEGTITTGKIYDISPLYDHVYCDGLYYRRTFDKSIISKVTKPEFAAIFEIGRIMAEKKISF